MDEFLYKLVLIPGIGGVRVEQDLGLDLKCSVSSCLNLAKGDIGLLFPAEVLIELVEVLAKEGEEDGDPVKDLTGGDWCAELRVLE